MWPKSVRARLLTALALLCCAVMATSVLTWVTLQRVDRQLDDLHRQSLSQVAQAIDLSKRSSDLATSAPYLLTQRSNFLIVQEGEALIAILENVREGWPQGDATADDADPATTLFDTTVEMETAISDLVATSIALDRLQTGLRSQIARLGELREDVTGQLSIAGTPAEQQLIWWRLQSMNADALSAAYAGNLIAVGEEQRHFQQHGTYLASLDLTEEQATFLAALRDLARSETGLFELRRRELSLNLNAQNALFRINHSANIINQLATDYARTTEGTLAAERRASSASLQITASVVTLITLLSMVLAMAAAIYVSRYVASNISRVSDAMVRLANGDMQSVLPRRLGGEDEIGALFRSFRSFRANALRLDRSVKLLDRRNALFEKVFANITDGIAITEPTGRLTAKNPAFERILDAHDINGPLVDWLSRSDFKTSAQALQLSHKHRGHLTLQSDAGQILEMRASRLPDDGRVWLISDVTEQRQVAARVEQIDRIELLGKLAGDTAHDFANILGAIRTHVYLLGSGQRDAKANVSAIENALDYGASLTDRLLAFARKQPLSPEVFDLNTLVEGMVDLVEIGLKPGVTFEVLPATAPVSVRADPGQLESAVLNLVLNANNAIGERGTITISVSNSGDGLAEITVSDTGSGMPADIQSKAIQPFFTTRSSLGGTGLGLSIVYGFINQSGGRLYIDSQEGRGTKVTISLPLAADAEAALMPPPRGRALLLDDNAVDRQATEKVLESLGFQATVCASGPEAIAALKENKFELVVSDFDLGGSHDGLDILALSEKLLPDAHRVLISGKSYLDDFPQSDAAFVEKPVTAMTLSEALRTASGPV